MKRTATIILNRNLPEITNELYDSIKRNNSDETDIYVVESGSSKDKLSKYCSFWANWDDAIANGLRYPRGFNFGLQKLYEEKKFNDYDYFFLVCNDSVFEEKKTISTLIKEMEAHPRMGILSPYSRHWGEHKLLKADETKYFWYINHVAWFIRREFIETIMERESPTYLNFMYDGSNFRGYGSDIELIVKGYANDWASAITTKVRVDENVDLLRQHAEAMKTDDYELNRKKVVDEGMQWLRRKYGFNSRWTMQMYAKFFYARFFEHYPELKKYQI